MGIFEIWTEEGRRWMLYFFAAMGSAAVAVAGSRGEWAMAGLYGAATAFAFAVMLWRRRVVDA